MKSKKTLSLLLALTLVTSASIVGCGKNNTPKDSSNASSSNKDNKKDNNKKKNTNNSETKKEKEENKDTAEVDKDQYLNIFVGEPKTIDPSRSTDSEGGMILTHIMDGLTRIEQDENGKDKIVPGIAESWDVSDDGLHWTFHLRDAKWADGEPITAEHFVYGMKRTIDPKTGSQYAWIIKDIKGAKEFNEGTGDADSVAIKAVDDKTLEIELANPIAYFLDLSYFRVMYPQRKDIVEKYNEAYGSEAEQMLSSGAFTLKSWMHDSKLEFVKNPNYWDAQNIKLDKLTMHIVKDVNASMNLMLNGSVDIGGATKTEWKEKFEKTGNFNFSAKSKPTVYYTEFNHKNKYFKNAKIRKAFTIALDRKDINDALYKGRHEPAFSLCPPTVQIAGESYREKCGVNYIQKLIDENPDPKALLIEGLKEEGLDPDPANMEVNKLLGSKNATAKERAEYEQDKLQNILGCKINLDFCDWAIFLDRTYKKDFEYADSGWSGDYNDPMTFFETLASYSGTNNTQWKNEEYNNIVIESTKTADNNKRFELFKRAEEIVIYEDCAISPRIFEKTSTYTRKYVKNVMTPLFGSRYDVTRSYTEGRK